MSDLAGVGSGGDLSVTVYESDGSLQTFVVPWQTPAISVKEGYLKYNLMAGRYRADSAGSGEDMVWHGTGIYGLPNDWTVYAGSQVSNIDYQSVLLGVGKNMGLWGAISVDGTIAQFSGAGSKPDKKEGDMLRFTYSKEFGDTGTTLGVASYQYATPDFYSLQDAMDVVHDNENDFDEGARKERRTAVSLSQSFGGGLGYASLSWARDDYQDSSSTDSGSASISMNFRQLTTTLSWVKNQNTTTSGSSSNDNIFSVMLTVPLDAYVGGDATASYTYTRPSDRADTQHQANLYGRSFNQQLNWNLRQTYSPNDSENNASSAVRLSWNDSYGQVGTFYSQDRDSEQTAFDASGSLIASSEGIVFGQLLSETTAILAAPKASGVSVVGTPGIKTDWRGYTSKTGLLPYQENILSLDVVSVSQDVDIEQTDIKVVPTAGAIIPARFSVKKGAKALVTIKQKSGQPIPFGSLVSLVDASTSSTGIADGFGQVFLTGMPENGELLVTWSDEKCRTTYHVPDQVNDAGIFNIMAVCH